MVSLTSSLLALTVFAASLLRPVVAFIQCNVLDYGAVADNSTDLGPALLSAWNNCVKAKATTVTFNGAQNWNLHITGNIYLPFNPSLTGTMLTFQNRQNILLNGPGAIYGNGYRYRPGGNLTMYPSRPRLIRFQDCNNCEITQVTLYDSPMFHVTMIGNNNVAHNMAILATNIGETDGFSISGNNNYVHDVTVQNGDECVTVKTPANGFRAESIQCRFTAGCNIGSFGSGTTGVNVQNVVYRNVTISNSDAGVEFKSYPNCAGTVRNISYSDFTLSAAAYPIAINSFWEGDGIDTGTLSITDVTFTNFHGTGTPTRPAVLLLCNKATPCKNIKFNSISITNAEANSFTNACGSGLSGLPGC